MKINEIKQFLTELFSRKKGKPFNYQEVLKKYAGYREEWGNRLPQNDNAGNHRSDNGKPDPTQ